MVKKDATSVFATIVALKSFYCYAEWVGGI